MNNIFFIILFAILLMGCSKNDDDQSEVNCDKLITALLNDNSEQLNFEINKLTQDLMANPTQNDETGQLNNLNTLIDRLNSSCGGLRAVMKCYACFDTFPLQSEVKIIINNFGIEFVRLVDISTPDDGILESLRSHGDRQGCTRN